MMDEGRPRLYVFYDYVCPYAYVGKLRVDALVRRYDLQTAWLPWEIHPDRAPAGEPIDRAGRVARDQRWVDALAEEMGAELTVPHVAINSNLALRGAEHAKDRGGQAFERYHAAAFEAVWLKGRDLGDLTVLAGVARTAGLDATAFFQGVSHHAYQARLDLVDQAATRLGIQRVPTFVFGDQRIVGNDRFEPSLLGPLESFLERWKTLGDAETSTLERDTGLQSLL